LTRDNVRIKIVIIKILKFDSRISLSHGLGGSTRVDLGQRTIKMIIIIILKLNLEVDLGQGMIYGSGGSTRVDSSQHMDKNNNYYNFKT
jgi:hypothetical protein